MGSLECGDIGMSSKLNSRSGSETCIEGYIRVENLTRIGPKGNDGYIAFGFLKAGIIVPAGIRMSPNWALKSHRLATSG